MLNKKQTITVALAVLILSGGTVAAQTLVVGSEHTTFGTGSGETDPKTLDNVTIEGSGESASVSLIGDTTIDKYNRDSLGSGYTGDTGFATISTSSVYEGSGSLRLESDGGPIQVDNTGGDIPYPSAGDSFQFWAKTDGANDAFMKFGVQGSSSYYAVGFRSGGDDIQIRKDSSTSSIATQSVSLADNTWYRGVVDWGSGGTITFTLYDASGTQLASTSVTDTAYSSGGVGFLTNGPSTGTYSYFDNVKIVRDTPQTAKYVSATHDVSDASEARVNITEASGVSVNVTVRTGTGTVLGTGTYTSAGEKTISLSNTTETKIETVVTVEKTGSSPQFGLASESILVPESTATEDGSGVGDTEPMDLAELWNDPRVMGAVVVLGFAGIGLGSGSLTVSAWSGYVAFVTLAFKTEIPLFRNIALVTLVLVFLGMAFKLVRLEFEGES